MKLPKPELAIVISRKIGVRFGLLTAGMQEIPGLQGILADISLKSVSANRSILAELESRCLARGSSSSRFSSSSVGIETM